jgi:hypothetical protein
VFGWGNENKGHLGDLDVEGRIILKVIFKKFNGSVSTEFICFSKRNRRPAVCNTERTVEFHKMRGIGLLEKLYSQA